MESSFDRRALPPGLQISQWRAGDGWAMRRFDWEPETPDPRGSILFQAGRGDFIEKYLEVYAHFRARGWRVSGFDWRGQGGSGRLHKDPLLGHMPSLDPLLDDLEDFAGQWRASSPGPHVLIGHSMGGNLALRLLAEREPRVDAAVLVAPMLGLNSGAVPAWAARTLARTFCLLGMTDRQAWREGDVPTALNSKRRANLTTCAERYADEAWWKAKRPELTLATPSWGWLTAAYRSVAKLDRRGALERVTTPVLLLAARYDRLVSAAAISRAAERLPDARLIVSDEAAHELLRETDPLRLPLLAGIDRFLDDKAVQR